MRAAAYREYGGPEVLRTHDRPRPTISHREVLIRVHAAGLNPIDYRIRKGQVRWLLPGGFPRVPGYDVAGVVEEAQPRSGFAPGDRVLAFLNSKYGGAYAEYAACEPECMTHLPDSISFLEGAGMPLAGSTALQCLRDYGNLRSGNTVLINGANGGVGAFAVQIAKAYGALVTGITSASHFDFVRQLGADRLIDYRETDFQELPQHWDIIFDAAGKASYHGVRHVLADGGHYVSTEPSLRGYATNLLTAPLSKRGHVMLVQSRASDLRELVRLAVAGKLKTHIERVFPLEQAAEAQRHLEEASICGKVILVMDEATSPS